MLKSWHTVILNTVTISATLVSFAANSLAQNITLDGSLGKKEILTGPNYEIRQSLGKTVGNNLFHSFGKFNLDANESAIFHSTDNIHNILSRVTGSNPSSIDGLIRTLGKDVNLFLINPNGIIFGKNARLDVSGSFVASTADSFVFGDGIEFSATNPQAAPLLEVDLTLGLQYGKNHLSRTVKSTGNLTTGKDLKLFAGNLDLQGKLQAGRDLTLTADTIKIRDSVTSPFIAQAGHKLSILGKESVDIFALNHPNSGLFSGGNMMLASSNPVVGDIHFWSGGNFQIEKLDRNKGDLFSFYDPIIRSQGDVSFFAYQGASLHILAGGKVDINTVVITNPDTVGESINPTTTPNLANVTLSDGTSLIIDGSKKPTLDIRAGVDLAIIGNPLGSLGNSGTFFDFSITPVTSPNNNPVATSADINIGNVSNSGGTVLLTNQYQPNPALSGGIIVGNIDTSGNFGGDVFIDSKEDIALNSLINLSGGDIFSSNFLGDGGDISLLADGDISLGSEANIFSLGLLGGKITFNSNANIFIKSIIQTSSFTDTVTDSSTKGGDINIAAKSLEIADDSILVSTTTGKANGGNINFNANENTSIKGFNTLITTQVANPNATGNAGIVSIRTNRLNIDEAVIQSDTFGAGNAGDLKIEVDKLRLIGGAQVASRTFNKGDTGELEIKTRSLEVIGRTKDGEFPSGLFVRVQAEAATGNGGNLTIKTEDLLVTGGAKISATTFGKGHAGNVTIKADSVEVTGESTDGQFASGLFAQATPGSSGNGGSLTIETEHLLVTGGAQIAVATWTSGNAGELKVKAQSVEAIGRTESGVSPSGLFTQVNPGATGSGGNLIIDTISLKVADGAEISAGTFGDGNVGSIEVTANIFETSNSGKILTTTSSKFNAGNIILNVKDNITLSGLESGIFANTTENSTGNGGGIIIDPKTLNIKEGAQISVDSQGTGKGGNINLAAGFLNLNNGTISAQTRSNTGGNINLNLQNLLLLRNGSQISTTAGNQQFGGDGGNITINTPFIVALPQENSDITANAFSGNGGKIDITTNAIFGIFPRDTSTLFSDITASSQLGVNGEISIDAPDLDPSSGLVELPSNLVDTSQQIAQGCSTTRSRKKVNSFTRIGRGGLPLSPNESLRGRAVITNWVDLPSQIANKRPNQRENQLSRVTVNGSQSSDRNQIVEAQDLVVDAKGDIFLVAKSTQSNITPSGFACSK